MVRRRSFGGLLAGIVLLALLAGGILYRQRIMDQVKVWQFTPTPGIMRLAERAQLSDEGRFYFYVTHPRLETAAEFNDDCRRKEANSPLLGCYVQGADRIHIFNVDNPELDGIKEVTAAHEMLHAVYARLSEARRRELGEQLEAAYQRVKDAELEQRMAYYERQQPGSRQNELHSILGTEYESLGPELEAHYARYFRNRQVVVGLHRAYHQTFRSLEQEQQRLSGDLAQRRTTLEQRMARYQQQVAALNARIGDFNRRAAAGDFASEAAFQRERGQLRRDGDALKREQAAIETAVNEYNNDVTKLNELGGKMEQLQKSLDSFQAVERS